VQLRVRQHQLHLADFPVKQGAEAESRNLVSREPTWWGSSGLPLFAGLPRRAIFPETEGHKKGRGVRNRSVAYDGLIAPNLCAMLSIAPTLAP